MYFFEGEEKFANYTYAVCWDYMTYIRYMKWRVSKRFKPGKLPKGSIWSHRTAYSKRWMFKELPGKQNRLVKAESHTSGLAVGIASWRVGWSFTCKDFHAHSWFRVVQVQGCWQKWCLILYLSDVKLSITLERQPWLRLVSAQLTEFKDSFWINGLAYPDLLAARLHSHFISS